MRFENVCIASVAPVLPDEVVTSEQIEQRLEPLYERLRLPVGRLELMSGIRERRFFPPGVLPGDISIRAAQAAWAASGLPVAACGACIHGSVCRDCLEPATACRVHHALGLPNGCIVQDVSNACLGVLSGALQIATMIELGQIEAGLVVGAECGRTLVENTINQLNADQSATRGSVKNSFASLTIGSASAAMVLCSRKRAPNAPRLCAATVYADTSHHTLCQSDGLTEVMQTDSEALLHAGVAAGRANFDRLLSASDWKAEEIDLTVCHQVGGAHRKLMLQSLELPIEKDFATFDWLGNTGAAAAPSALGLAIEQGAISPGNRVAVLGIGSGVNCLMMAIEWGELTSPTAI